MFSGQIPTIGAIQRTNVMLLVVSAAILAYFYSAASAMACVLGGAVVIANLFLLSMLGRFALAAAGSGGTAAKFGLAALPLKLLLLAGLLYLVFSQWHIDGVGFGLGILTQFTAIIIETGRASVRKPAKPALAEESCKSL